MSNESTEERDKLEARLKRLQALTDQDNPYLGVSQEFIMHARTALAELRTLQGENEVREAEVDVLMVAFRAKKERCEQLQTALDDARGLVEKERAAGAMWAGLAGERWYTLEQVRGLVEKWRKDEYDDWGGEVARACATELEAALGDRRVQT